MKSTQTTQQIPATSGQLARVTGGLIGPVLAAIGAIVAVAAIVGMIVGDVSPQILVAGILLLIGGLILHQITLGARTQERDMTELMEVITDLND